MFCDSILVYPKIGSEPMGTKFDALDFSILSFLILLLLTYTLWGLLEECKSSEFISSLKGNLLLLLIFIFIWPSLLRDFILFGQVCI